MARQPDIQYIQPYTYGNTARKLELKPRRQKAKYRLPEEQPQHSRAASPVFDPVSMCATVVAALMLIALMVGMFQLVEETGRNQQLANYVETLHKQGADLHMAYENAYDLQKVEERALQMGMIYASEAEHITVESPVIQTQPEPGFGDQIKAFFSELFAKAPH